MAPTPACALVPPPPALPSARPCALVPTNSGRRRFAVAAASPLVEEAVRATEAEPLTKEDLVAYLASGCKPRSDWRIGTEHEKFGFQVETLRPINYQQIRDLLNGVADRFGGHRVMEGNNIVGLKQGSQNISMEPGGQIELSGAPLETLHQTRAEVNSHLCQVKAVGEELGIGFLGLGFQPNWALSDMPIMPKAKFEIARNYMPKVGSSGLDMMFRTCSVQVNLDYGSEQDMIMKLRAAIALQPIATAIFANSPFKEGKLSGFLSLRSYTYTDTDSDRTGMLPFVFDSSFGFERYMDYVLDVPMYFVCRNKRHINCTGMSFRDFMAGKLPQVPGERPTLNDWEVRLKRFLEMRGADGGPFSTLCALPAFWVGLLYDDESLRCITDMIADWTSEERDMLRRKVPVTGLKTQFRGGYVRDLAENLVKLAKDGLQRRGHMEAGFLDEVDEVVSTGVTQAEKLAKLYKTKWQHNVDPVFREFIY
ncbi:glutamate--cysteine ligase B, chloroplastic-like [Panicum miliaceum]|uniref:Glutamate--cysteine ligase n=1 Tax=Panicum miliaceum TaxID=4540 RepID=A0A3L6QX84_PANMI|nr:glutamate--cysteine ligase B, chloroplastic-like [Panicum miliaceum]